MSKVTENGIKKFLEQTKSPMIEELFCKACEINTENDFNNYERRLEMLRLNHDDDYHWYNIGYVALYGIDGLDEED